MCVSRRAVLTGSASIAVATFSAIVPGADALAQLSPVTRRSVGDLPANDPHLQALRDGVRLMRQLGQGDRRNWNAMAAVHGTSQGFNLCPHGNWYFLPWHRGYLLSYERIIRELTGFRQFALPYWDWTRDRQLPTHFSMETVNGQPNPLFQEGRTIGSNTLPDNVVGPTVLYAILAERPFERFGSSRPHDQNSTDPIWMRRRGTSGTLESNPHNMVHGRVGGIMAGPGSAADPIFLMHHCNIDRIWAVWLESGGANSTDPLWTKFSFTNHFVDNQGNQVTQTVADLLSTISLGYRYGLDTRVSDLISSRLRDNRDILRPIDPRVFDTQVLTPRRTPITDPPPVVLRGRSAVGLVAQAASVPIRVPSAQIARAVTPTRQLGGAESILRETFSAPVPSLARMVARIRGLVPAASAVGEYRVFVNCPYLNTDTPPTDPHYVTSFSFFGADKHAGHGGGGMDIVVDLTRTLQSVARQQRGATDEVNVQIQPVAIPGAPPPADVQVGSVEIAII